jgi:aquaporin Z
MRSQVRKYTAEFVSTFIMVFCGTGAIIINQESGGVVTHMGIAITFGLVVMSMIYSFGSISGAHMNPAVSIALTISGKHPLRDLMPFVLSQLAGAIAASCTLRALFPTSDTLGSTLPAGSAFQSFILEFFLTFFLMLVILSVGRKSKKEGSLAGIVIGGVVGLEAMFAGPICGASMNPARSLAPAVISGHTEHLWVYLSATVFGAMMAVLVGKFLLAETFVPKTHTEVEKSRISAYEN